MINITIDKPKNIDKKKLAEKLVNILLNILIVVFSIVLLISLYTMIQIKILGHKYANFFGYSMFEVQTGSMSPTLEAGDWIIVKLTNKVDIDDVVTYEHKGNFITHRIVEVYNGTFVTKGDYNVPKDDPIDQSQVIGKLSKKLGNFGVVRKTLLNLPVLVTLIISLFLLNSVLKKDDKTLELLKKIKDKGLSLGNKIRKKEVVESNDDEVSVLDDKILEEINSINIEDLKLDMTQTNIPIPVEESEEVQIEQISSPESPPAPEAPETISVDVPEIESEDEIVEEPPIPEASPNNLEETSLFRVISVDVSELNETKLEIAINEMDEENKKENIELPTIKEEVEPTEEEQEEKITDIELKSQKGNKNVIVTLMNIKKEEFSELVWLFDEDGVLEVNEPTIKNTITETYIDARYYNYYGKREAECKGRSLITRIEKALELSGEDLINSYKGRDNKYEEKVSIHVKLLKLIANFEQARDSVTEVPARREFIKNQIKEAFGDWDKEKIDNIASEVMRIQKTYSGITKYYLKKLETETFYLDFDKIPSRKNMWVTDLRHKVEFNRLYSNYVINKTYKEGIIAEDKISVLLTLLSRQLIDDMINTDFNKQYIIYIPRTLYQKERKLLGLLKLIEDEYAKAHTLIAILLPDLKKSKSLVGKIKKCGFKFALAIDNETEVLDNEQGMLYLLDGLFVNKEHFDTIIHNIPEDLRDIVIYDDIIRYIDDMEEEEE